VLFDCAWMYYLLRQRRPDIPGITLCKGRLLVILQHFQAFNPHFKVTPGHLLSAAEEGQPGGSVVPDCFGQA